MQVDAGRQLLAQIDSGKTVSLAAELLSSHIFAAFARVICLAVCINYFAARLVRLQSAHQHVAASIFNGYLEPVLYPSPGIARSTQGVCAAVVH